MTKNYDRNEIGKRGKIGQALTLDEVELEPFKREKSGRKRVINPDGTNNKASTKQLKLISFHFVTQMDQLIAN